MPQLAEILLSEAIHGCTEHLRGAADEIMYLRLERSTVAVVPGVGRDVAVLYEDCCRIPVLRLALEPIAALENQDVLACGSELSGERAATRPAAYDDDVEALIHISLRLETGAAMHDAAIREDGRRGEIACAVAGEEPDDGGNLPRAYSNDQDVVFGKFHTRGAREHTYAALAQTIRSVTWHRPVFMYRGDVDDTTAATLLDHLLGRNLRAEEGALEVDPHYLVVLVLGGVEDRSTRFDASVVYHDIHAAEPAHRRVDELLQVGELAHIGFDSGGLITEFGDLLLERLSRLGMNYIIDGDARTQPGQFQNNRLTDPAVPTGDDGNLVL